MSADLHIHSRFSDGTFSAEQIVAAARQHDLAALALTDHDTVEGCASMAEACAAAGIEFIPGVELTAEQNDHEVHILGYGFDCADEAFLQQMQVFQSVRQNRIREVVARLNELNVVIEADAVFALANCRSPGRPHVARALVAAGVCSSLDQAFERFLKKHRPAWVPKFKISARDALELIHQAGGAAILAHPGLNRIDEMIPDLVRAGLDGIECFHTKHSTATSQRYLEMADQLGVLVTGGSDCHGLNKGKPLIGSVKLPYLHVEELKRRVGEIRRSIRAVEIEHPPAPGRPS